MGNCQVPERHVLGASVQVQYELIHDWGIGGGANAYDNATRSMADTVAPASLVTLPTLDRSHRTNRVPAHSACANWA
jgi:hypothetical protein